MAAIRRLTSIAFLTLGLLTTLSTRSAAQIYSSKSGKPFGYTTGDVMVDSVPTFSLYAPTGGKNILQTWAHAAPGAIEAYALAYHTDLGSYQVDIGSLAGFEFDDLLFSSGGSGPINVGLLLTVDGFATQALGGQVNLILRVNNVKIGSANLTGSGITTTGVLTGYGMQGPISFQYDYTATINVPEDLEVTLEINALTGVKDWRAEAQYKLTFGGASPSGPTPVYVLPGGGVTVDSVQARIQNNLWEESTELYLTPSEPIFDPGETLDITTWNGIPSTIYALMVTDVGGFPFTKVMLVRPLDGEGQYSVGTFAHDPALSGNSIGLLAMSLDANDVVILSDPKSVTIQ